MKCDTHTYIYSGQSRMFHGLLIEIWPNVLSDFVSTVEMLELEEEQKKKSSLLTQCK